MLTYPRCKDCGHSKSKHTTRRKLFNLSKGDNSPICKDCYKFWDEGATYERDLEKSITDVDMWHVYRPDNLEYLERKYETAAKLRKTT